MAPAPLPGFDRLRVAVVGDLVADHYLVTEPRGLSREAPVMVLRHTGEQLGAGGAANVARNVAALGARTLCLGAVGPDARGRELIELLERDGIDVGGISLARGYATPTKTRVVAAEPRRNLQQVLRIDREPAAPVEDDVRERIARAIAALAGEIDALVVSDYDYGLARGPVAAAARELARERCVVVMDPRSELEGFEGLSALTPNVAELARFAGFPAGRLGDARELARAAAAAMARARPRWLLVTRGNLGMALYGEDVPEGGALVEASGQGNVTDVSGAGDTAAAVFALALAAGAGAARAMVLANAAAGVVVMESGTAVCTPAQLAAALPLAPAPIRAPGSGVP